MLKDHGYQTAAIGKWHLGLEWALKDQKDYDAFFVDEDYAAKHEPKYQKGRHNQFGNQTGEPYIRGLDIDYTQPITFGPNQLGFDYFYGTPASLDQGPFVTIENDRVIDQPTVVTGVSGIDRVGSSTQRTWEQGVASPEHSPYHLPDIMQAKVMEVLEDYAEGDQPFFIYYPTHLVHGPLLPAERFKGQSGIGDYSDFVLQLDSYVGEMIDYLEAQDLYDDTIFIFTSDNGVSGIVDPEGLKADHGHDSSAGYRGIKMDIWEGGHREPTIVSYPKLIEANTVSNHMVSHSDFYRTIAEILDADLDDETAEDSVSELSIWQGQDEPIRQDIIHSSGMGGFSIRRDFWKLNLVKDGGNFDQIPDFNDPAAMADYFKASELYDLRDDISESHNVIDDHPELVQELIQSLAQYIKEGRSTPGEAQSNQPDLPSGRWPQLAWMEDYEDYVDQVNQQGNPE